MWYVYNARISWFRCRYSKTSKNTSDPKYTTTMYLWVKYTTASRVYIHLVAKAVRIESAMG